MYDKYAGIKLAHVWVWGQWRLTQVLWHGLIGQWRWCIWFGFIYDDDWLDEQYGDDHDATTDDCYDHDDHDGGDGDYDGRVDVANGSRCGGLICIQSRLSETARRTHLRKSVGKAVLGHSQVRGSYVHATINC